MIKTWIAGFTVLFVFGLSYWLVGMPIVAVFTSTSWSGMTARDQSIINMAINSCVWTGLIILGGVFLWMFAAARKREYLDYA